ncbi:Zeta toxin family protein [Lamprobacter modestohalophilus]|uniref:Zeta toxin family protein n=1 Tax=Lamprobacter modestohalophilus TaxID=1064514 RepID=A0A9X1B4C2_9GAMM|nr:zeta toxin family protein [Lamprobacter modestohalophilus]MBK1619318.1 Zeta toxin family protein [Lamprobacter modestohalophilus]
MTIAHVHPRVLIIAGPNGAGKTTFAREFLPAEADCPDFVNADLIAAGLSPFKPEAVAYRAGRLMLQEIDRLAARGLSFALESTLSGKTYVSRILDWRRRGYLVELFFLSLPSADFAVSRVRQRVQEGGHHVPEATIRRRFAAGLDNFERLYKPIVDAWAMYDNSRVAPLLLEQGSHYDEND